MPLKITESFIPLGHPNRPGTKLYGVKARVWHGTANLNPTAGDEMHQKYVGRAYTKKWNTEKGKYEFFEADGKTLFRFGGAHVFIDKDSATITVPLDEVVWGCGDRPLPYDNGYKGQTKLAAEIFNNQNNYYTWNIELCMNDMNAWGNVLENAIEFVAARMPGAGIANYRHYDMTGKNCPGPFVNPAAANSDKDWASFRNRVELALKEESLPRIRVNGRIINDLMDVRPFFKDGRVMVPVRFVAEALGKKVTWLEKEQMVDIN